MIQTFIQNFDSFPVLQSPGAPSVILGLLRSRSIAGTIKRIDVYSGGDLEGAGSAIFNLSIGGVAQFSGSGRLIISSGESVASKTGLSIAVSRGDVVTLNLENNPRSNNLNPVTVLIDVDDGVTAGGGLTQEEVEDIVGGMFQTGTNMSFNYNDATGKLELDAIDISQEEIEDRIGALISAGANTTVTYNDGANTLTIAETTAGKTTEEIQDIVGALLANGANVTLTYDDGAGTLTIAAASGSGSIGIFEPDAPYASPSSYDDEFTAASLDAKWTRETSGGTPTLTFNSPPSNLKAVSASGVPFGYYQAVPVSGDWKFRAKVRGNGNSAAGIYIKYSTTFIAVIFNFNTNSFAVRKYTHATNLTAAGFSGTDISTNPINSLCSEGWVEIEYKTGVIYFRYSTDGVTFITRAGLSQGALTPTQIGIYGYPSANEEIFFDWFRKVDATGHTGRNI